MQVELETAMRHVLVAGLVAAAILHAPAAAAAGPGGPSVVVNGTTPGPTPFISHVNLTISPRAGLKSVSFLVESKPMSLTRPVAAKYSRAWLQGRGDYDPTTGQLDVPVFGLYAGFQNFVQVTVDFASGPSRFELVTIDTAPWVDPTGGVYTMPTIVQPRSTTANLSYDYIMLKGFAAPITPVIIDTDAEVRWVGTAGLASISSIFMDNRFYLANGAGITRMDLDGAHSFLADYSGYGVTFTGHHNFDPGRDGILIEVDTTSGVESTVMEVSTSGAVLRTWNLADIISDAMVAGGDDPSAFVRAPDDWFHNNSCTYDRRSDTLIVSGREDFVIGLDYDTGDIRWILGDRTKAWGQYPSLTKHALALTSGSLPPIGQHALSIRGDGDLLLFDNGRASLNHTPIGIDRGWSAPRAYAINERKMTATETWHHEASPRLNSPYCSSVYEDGHQNYLIDYTLTGDVMGLGFKGEKVFHYRYSTAYFCGVAWNAIPIHLEDLSFE